MENDWNDESFKDDRDWDAIEDDELADLTPTHSHDGLCPMCGCEIETDVIHTSLGIYEYQDDCVCCDWTSYPYVED